MKKQSRRVYMIRRAVALVILLFLAIGLFVGIFRLIKKGKARREAQGGLLASFLEEEEVNAKYPGTTFTAAEDGGTFEYGSMRIDPAGLVVSHTCDITVKDNAVIDTAVPGTYDITYVLEKVDRYGKKAQKEMQAHFTVADTAPPDIVLASPSVTIFTGEKFDPMSNVISSADPVDGSVSCSVGSDVNTSVPGTYTVTLTARDKNNNEGRSEYTVEVEEFAPASTPADGVYTYAFRINKAANAITVYRRDANGEYTVPCKAMVCSVGEDAPTGTFQTYDDPSNSSWSPEYPWWPLYSGEYGMFATGIVDSTLFQSVPYYSADPGDLDYEEYNKLGTTVTGGCVRVSVRDMMWIFAHCPKGTEVTFYEDEALPGPLGKPVPAVIDESSPNRGWDPTDPDPENPWNS